MISALRRKALAYRYNVFHPVDKPIVRILSHIHDPIRYILPCQNSGNHKSYTPIEQPFINKGVKLG